MKKDREKKEKGKNGQENERKETYERKRGRE